MSSQTRASGGGGGGRHSKKFNNAAGDTAANNNSKKSDHVKIDKEKSKVSLFIGSITVKYITTSFFTITSTLQLPIYMKVIY